MHPFQKLLIVVSDQHKNQNCSVLPVHIRPSASCSSVYSDLASLEDKPDCATAPPNACPSQCGGGTPTTYPFNWIKPTPLSNRKTKARTRTDKHLQLYRQCNGYVLSVTGKAIDAVQYSLPLMAEFAVIGFINRLADPVWSCGV